MHTHTHIDTHTYEKTPDERQTGSEFQTKDLEKNLGNFYDVVFVLILKDLLAAENNGLEYRLP